LIKRRRVGSQEPYHRTIGTNGNESFHKSDLNGLDGGKLGMLGGRIDRAVNGFRLRVMFVRGGMIVVCGVFSVVRMLSRVRRKRNLFKKVVDAVRR
jgi:hypothetical protein